MEKNVQHASAKKLPVRRHRANTNYDLTPGVLQDISWFREQLLTWFEQHGRSFPWREPERTPYEIIVAEILLQRTSAASVARVYSSFIERYPSWMELSRATLEDLHAGLTPVGLWRQKASVFQSLARSMRAGGEQVPTSRDELEELEGVGQYIASVILTAVRGQAEPFIDVNTARLLERFFGPRKLADIRDDPYLQTLARGVAAGENSLQVSWAILDFSAKVCKPNRPLCKMCPLQAKCRFLASITEQ